MLAITRTTTEDSLKVHEQVVREALALRDNDDICHLPLLFHTIEESGPAVITFEGEGLKIQGIIYGSSFDVHR